jgi:hypothetical protein
MLVSCARHETPAIKAARRAERLGERTRLERWARIPVPRTYAPPRRRSTGVEPPRRAQRAPKRAPKQAPKQAPKRPAAAATRARRAS